MNTYQPRVACTASGMTFEQWRQRPAHRVHCLTWDVAKLVVGVNMRQGDGLGSPGVINVPGADALDTFRHLAPFRSRAASLLRQRVANEVREMRRQCQIMV